MTIRDFAAVDGRDFEARLLLWGREGVPMTLILPEEESGKEKALEAHLPDVERELQWLDQAFPTVVRAVLEEDMVSLAEDWASSAPVAEEETQDCYVMEDGQKVFLPITEKAFCQSLYPDGIGLSFEEGWDRPSMDLYLCCSPDYFAGHCIAVSVDRDHRVTCDGLAG